MNQLTRIIQSTEVAEMVGREHKNVMRDISAILTEFRRAQNSSRPHISLKASILTNKTNNNRVIYLQSKGVNYTEIE